MTQELGCTEYQAIIGLSAYVISYAITPLFTSAFSEEFGRQPLYWGSVILFCSMHIMIALQVLNFLSEPGANHPSILRAWDSQGPEYQRYRGCKGVTRRGWLDRYDHGRWDDS
jgi:hypothetical protein